MARYGSCTIIKNDVFWEYFTEMLSRKGSGMTCMSSKLNNIQQVGTGGKWT